MQSSLSSIAMQLADYACQALQEELDTTPKCGLVDKRNNGAHNDMTYSQFVASINALHPCYKSMAELRISLPEGANDLRQLGLLAEGAMYKATGGINTHKGAIFALGLAVYAYSQLSANNAGTNITIEDLLNTISITASALPTPCTAGSLLCKQYCIPSAYDYAVQGYPQLIQALAVMKSNAFLGENIANLKVLLYYSTCLHDSCIYRRVGRASAEWWMRSAKQLYRDFSLAKAEQLDDECIARNISGGGAADMLSLTLFVNKLLNANLICL